MEEKKIKQKDMCRTVDCDKLAVTIFDAFKEDREESGINEIAEGQNLLVAVVNRLRNGETAEQIIASGVDAQTVALAQSIK